MENISSRPYTMLARSARSVPLERLAAPTMTGAAFAFSDGPVATVEMLAADGGWMIAQSDLIAQLS